MPRVLLVDDDPVLLRVLEVNFRLSGFEVIVASRGEEALTKAAGSPPDAAVLDLVLPGTDGFELCSLLRRLPGVGAIPVVFLSGRARSEDPEPRDLPGRTDRLAKPFDPEDLVELVRSRIGS
jgi:DNA-binding response OmpR family regulator